MFPKKFLGVVAVSSAVLLGAGAVLLNGRAMAEKDQGPTQSALRSAQDLSSAFRSVSKSALPSIVSIKTVSKPVAKRRSFEDQFGENSPFGDIFRDHPQFRDMFKDLPKQPERIPDPRDHGIPGLGSGFVIDPSGIVMTNNHVVANADRIVVVMQDGTEYTATPEDVKTDPRTDVAIVRIKPDHPLPAIKLGNSDLMEVGDWVLAIGTPFGLNLTVTQGIISAKGRGMNITDREDFLQTDAAINPGNSGGPLINLNGEVIGINTAISSRSGGYDGVGFAIPINMARWVGDQLVENGRVKRAYLGVAIGPVDAKLAKYLPKGARDGVVIGKVTDESPAANAKLQESDIILKLNGQEVKDTRTLQGIVEKLDVGKSYPMEIIRDGAPMTVDVTMEEMPEDFTQRINGLREEQEEQEEDSPKSMNFKELGLNVQPLTPAIVKSLGFTRPVQGVVITDVLEGSPAERANLAPEMVVTKVGNKPVANLEEFESALKSENPSKGLLLFVVTPQGGRFVELLAETEKSSQK
ncbi:MAG: Do family serine endopeptidase [Planctomycetaceae bacterium]|nr:Do family serine endopeptidase [Planctomycetaceae bacterium]